MGVLRYRVVAFIAAAFLVVATSGFAGGKQEQPSSASTGGEPVTITFSAWGQVQEFDLYKSWFPAFEKMQPRIKLNLETQPGDQYPQKMVVLFAGGTAPDVIRLPTGQFDFIEKGMFEPLDSYISGPKGLDRADFYDAAWGLGAYKGKVWVLPQDLNCINLYYNVDLYAKAGLSVPNKAAPSWKQVAESVQKLTKDTKGIVDQWGFALDSIDNLWVVLLWQNDGHLFNADKTKAAFNDPRGLEVTRYVIDLVRKYRAAPPSPSASWQGSRLAFQTAKVATTFEGAWMRPPWNEQKGLTYKVVEPPAFKSNGNKLIGSSFGINSKSKHKAEAWEVVKFLTDTQRSVEWANLGVALPPRKSSAASQAFKRDETTVPFLNQLAYANAEYFIPQGSTALVVDIVRKGLQSALAPNSTRTAEDVLKDMEQATNKLLAGQ